jgi:translin
MRFERVEASLGEVARELEAVVKRREQVLKASRDVTLAAARAIVKLHSGQVEEARTYLAGAEQLLGELRELAGEDLARYLVSPETEYVEARVVAALIAGQDIPVKEELKVSSTAYLHGLLDALGEVKRLILDSIRRGEAARAEALFSVMERLYVALAPFAVYDNVAAGVKRKLDVARGLVESVRMLVTEEARRELLLAELARLNERLDLEEKG